MDFQDVLRILAAMRPLGEAEAEGAFEQILEGRVTEDDIVSFLSHIAARPGGPVVEELVGGVRVFRRFATTVKRPQSGPFAGGKLLDTCGTGGAPKLFNVSTAAGLVAAAASGGRVMVAKHGNVSRTGRGTAEVLRELGVNIDASGEAQTRCLGEAGFCFAMAPRHHPAARHAAAARKKIGVSTIFNLLGPLANPAGAEYQIIGTWSHANARLMAEALRRLGTQGRAWVYSSRDGLDELTTTAGNVVNEVKGEGWRSEFEVDAADLGLARARVEELQVGSLAEAVEAVGDVLKGVGGPRRDMVVLSAGAALVVSGCAAGLDEGVSAAEEAIDSGAAAETLRRVVELSNARA